MIGRGVLLIGVPASVIGFLISALVFSALDLPAAALPWIAAFPLLLGSYLAGHYAARRRRFHGWQTGMAAGVLLTGLWYTAACLTAGGLCAPTVLPVAAVSGLIGGVRGVNREAPPIRRRSHGIIYLIESVKLHLPGK